MKKAKWLFVKMVKTQIVVMNMGKMVMSYAVLKQVAKHK